MLWPIPLALVAAAAGSEYHWYKRAGNNEGGSVNFTSPSVLSEPPSWVWPNEDDELCRHAPVIDSELNIYLATSRGRIRKFRPEGTLVWQKNFTREEGRTFTSPYLFRGKLYITSMGRSYEFDPRLQKLEILTWCLDMETGAVVWMAPGPEPAWTNMDSFTIHASPEGVLLAPKAYSEDRWDGNNVIYAQNASDGRLLWEIKVPGSIWNFMPTTPGDGTFYFSSTCGVARRMNITDGSLLWKGPVPDPVKDNRNCGTGGGVLGANGVFYAVANWWNTDPNDVRGGLPEGVTPCNVKYCPEGMGIIFAYKRDDGQLLWSRRLGSDFGGMQYPTVGKLGGRWAVVAGIGNNPNLPELFLGPAFLPALVRMAIQKLQVLSRPLRRFLGVPIKRNAIIALDAETGELLFTFEEEPWDYLAAAGDEWKLFSRMMASQQDPQIEPLCGPDNFGIPSIAGDGTVYAASGSNGKIYAIRDADNNRVIDQAEVSTFDTGIGFLQNPALAPGLLAAAPCWGPMYVWRTTAS